MSKHTPGPWKVFDGGTQYPGIEAQKLSVVVFGDGWGEGVQGDNEEEIAANARLIAAAPDCAPPTRLPPWRPSAPPSPRQGGPNDLGRH